MYEVEAKVRISKDELKRLRRRLPEIAESKKNVVSKDFYYGGLNKYYLRLREKNGNSVLNLKSKCVKMGIEMNQEIELPIKSISGFKDFLKKTNIPMTARKEKKGEIYKKGDINIELNFIKKLGYFLEIEVIARKKTEIPKAKRTLLNIFSELGFKPRNFEKRYYLELLYK